MANRKCRKCGEMGNAFQCDEGVSRLYFDHRRLYQRHQRVTHCLATKEIQLFQSTTDSTEDPRRGQPAEGGAAVGPTSWL